MCHCSILDSFSLPFRDEETLAHAQHKGWDDPVLEAMAAPGKVPEVVDAGAQKLDVAGGDGFSTHRMENGLRMGILEMTNCEEGMKIRMISDEKNVRDFQRLGSYSFSTTRLTSDDRTGSSSCGT